MQGLSEEVLTNALDKTLKPIPVRFIVCDADQKAAIIAKGYFEISTFFDALHGVTRYIMESVDPLSQLN